MTKNKREKHGLSPHPLYKVWVSMKQRCYNKNAYNFHSYGGRGITICKEWRHSAKTFVEWCENNGYKRGLQIDRADNNFGYSPDNCRFVTNKVNCRNQRISKWWYINSVRYESAAQAAKSLKVGSTTIAYWCQGYLRNGKLIPPKPNCYSELKYIEAT